MALTPLQILRNPSNQDAIPHIFRTDPLPVGPILTYSPFSGGGGTGGWGDSGNSIPDWMKPNPGGSGDSNTGGGGVGAIPDQDWTLLVPQPVRRDEEPKLSDQPVYVQPTINDPFYGQEGGASGRGDSVSLPAASRGTGWVAPIFKDDGEGDGTPMSSTRLPAAQRNIDTSKGTIQRAKEWWDNQSDVSDHPVLDPILDTLALATRGATQYALQSMIAPAIGKGLVKGGAKIGNAVAGADGIIPGAIGGMIGSELITDKLVDIPYEFIDRNIIDPVFYKDLNQPAQDQNPNGMTPDEMKQAIRDKAFAPQEYNIELKPPPEIAQQDPNITIPGDGVKLDEVGSVPDVADKTPLYPATDLESGEIVFTPNVPDSSTMVQNAGDQGGWKFYDSLTQSPFLDQTYDPFSQFTFADPGQFGLGGVTTDWEQYFLLHGGQGGAGGSNQDWQDWINTPLVKI